ncbi:VanZ family protein [Chengkuizengella axinellae]|uniref:VanZ family protein n=1 Tax=Chengkuizengella axinellae TaxID=3064388 RepID=A0ABT9IZE8_9BACL|nr:VanZ family protein [Chengkuizengella sp. 2205SS18-9]MDP5274169.1 VanZ family protein [Chengkuizengella sp. 2205SS18-9]
MDKSFETYINKIVKNIKTNKEEKMEIAEELKDHLILLKNEFIEKGYSEKGAIAEAIRSFGDHEQLESGFQKSISPYYSLYRIFLWSIFVIYILYLLLSLIIRFSFFNTTWFQDRLNENSYVDLIIQNTNIIPLKTILTYIIQYEHFLYEHHDLSIFFENIFGNIILFIPFGLLISILFISANNVKSIFIITLTTSFFIEMLQVFSLLAIFDIDDIILHSFGAVIGFYILKAFKRIAVHIRTTYITPLR